MIALVLMNLDRFCEINDTLGHDVGDALLVQVADRFAKRGDRHPGDVFRLGGEAFAVVVPDAETVGDVESVARRLLGSLAQPLRVVGTGLEI